MSVSQIEKKGKEIIIKDGKIKIRNISIFQQNELCVKRSEKTT